MSQSNTSTLSNENVELISENHDDDDYELHFQRALELVEEKENFSNIPSIYNRSQLEMGIFYM